MSTTATTTHTNTEEQQLSLFPTPRPRWCVVRSNEGGRFGAVTMPGNDDLLTWKNGRWQHFLTIDTRKGSVSIDKNGNAMVTLEDGRRIMYRGRDGVKVALAKVVGR
jgi:hypothetical protein